MIRSRPRRRLQWASTRSWAGLTSWRGPASWSGAGGATGEYLGRLQGILQRRYRTERHEVALHALPIARQF